MMRLKHYFRFFLPWILILSTPAFTETSHSTPPLPPGADSFIEHMVKRYHYDRDTLLHVLRHAHYEPTVIKYMTAPYEAKPWYIYRRFFITHKKIQHGVIYWKQYRTALEAARARFHVPPSIIVAIIGIETDYGNNIDNYSAVNALSTLAFYYKPRQAYFQKELAQLFLLSKEKKIPILSIKSSYAGAIGIPQFMPSAYRQYAISHHHQGFPNLMINHADAILSVGKFLHDHGWNQTRLIAKPLPTQYISPEWIKDKPQLNFTILQLQSRGIHLPSHLPLHETVSLIRLQDHYSHQYWIVNHNFLVILKYNPSINYAMAVYQLSQAIREAYLNGNKNDQRTTQTRRALP